KVSTFLQLFSLYIQDFTHVIQGKGKSQHGRLDGRTLPSFRGELPAKIPGNTGTLKLSIECCFCNRWIFQGCQHPLWKILPTGKVCNLSRLLIKCISKK